MVAVEMQESLCDVARKAAAANGLSNKISVVQVRLVLGMWAGMQVATCPGGRPAALPL